MEENISIGAASPYEAVEILVYLIEPLKKLGITLSYKYDRHIEELEEHWEYGYEGWRVKLKKED